MLRTNKGVMAIAMSDCGTFAKPFAEAIEDIDRRQTEGVQAMGANRLQAMRFGMLPHVLPVMMSHSCQCLTKAPEPGLARCRYSTRPIPGWPCTER
jgi:ABC-type phosphate/phosphonate transport system permease subunit